jgi:ethanolamine utilization cobalamin adenosyltransferase
VDETNAKIQVINEKIVDFAKPEYLTIITNEIIEAKEKANISYKSIERLVADFSTLNYLLSEKKVKEPKKEEIKITETIIQPPIIETIIEPVEIVEKQDANKIINSLKIALKFADKEMKLKIEKEIKALNISLKYA